MDFITILSSSIDAVCVISMSGFIYIFLFVLIMFKLVCKPKLSIFPVVSETKLYACVVSFAAFCFGRRCWGLLLKQELVNAVWAFS